MANYLAAILIIAAVALFVAAPLSGGFPRRRRSTTLQLELERLEHERGLAMQGLRELEFDHEMGKLDEVDYHNLKRSLEDRALSAMTAIERARGAMRAGTIQPAARPARIALARVGLAAAPAPRAPSARGMAGAAGAGHPPGVNFCPQCGVRAGTGHNFCAECGASLRFGVARTSSRAD